MADHNAKLVWRNGMIFDTVSDGKTHLPLTLAAGSENPEDAQQGLSPMGILLSALAGCTAMDVMSILKKKRQNVTSFEVEVEGDQATSHPHVYRDISVVYRVGGVQVDAAAVERAIELSVTKYCSVYATLKELADIKYRYEISEVQPS